VAASIHSSCRSIAYLSLRRSHAGASSAATLRLRRQSQLARSLPGLASSVVVGPLIYVRFQGATKYAGSYDDVLLDDWAAWLAKRVADGLEVFAYFNNDSGGHAPRDAVHLSRSAESGDTESDATVNV
jgi:uncharacterized protein YecE (DUF72 family)